VALRFWLDRGVDGIRLDAVLRVLKDPAMRDNPPNPDLELVMHRPMGDFDAQLHIHDGGHADVHGLFRELRQLLEAYGAERPRMAIAELHVFDWQEWASYYGVELDELHLPFNFGLLKTPWNARSVGQLIAGIEASLPPGAWPNYVLGNHDEPRIATRVGPRQARVAMMLLLTLRGTPTLYYGDELGMRDVPIAPERARDPWGKLVPGLGLGRDPQRTPMPWQPASNAGFCAPGVEPWLPLGEDHRETNVAVESDDKHSPLALTRALLALRRAHPALHAGSYQAVTGVPDDCLVYLRERGVDRTLVAMNFAAGSRHLALPGLGRARIVLSTSLDREGPVDLGSLELRGDEGCVIEIESGDSP
jgi:alpha-glucosidase